MSQHRLFKKDEGFSAHTAELPVRNERGTLFLGGVALGASEQDNSGNTLNATYVLKDPSQQQNEIVR